jgi:cyclopropane fatty-acyl-phospholipid synthase-like methyltransferase
VLADLTIRGDVLDLGAGLGGNAIFLASRGIRVTAVEASPIAVQAFTRKRSALPDDVASRINIVHSDVRSFRPTQSFGAVVAYGLLHSIHQQSEVEAVVRMMQGATAAGGFNVAVAITNRIPAPACQPYLEPLVISEHFVRQLYADWSFHFFEHVVLRESHPTTNTEHEHSICRLLAAKRPP